jgi:bacillithiol system protein YtxJ
MDWIRIQSPDQIDAAIEDSHDQIVLIYKHSPICGLSSHAHQKLENGKAEIIDMKLKTYFVDVVSQRQLSRSIAERFNIVHQSPQVLLIKDGECIYDTSHFNISIEKIKKAIG